MSGVVVLAGGGELGIAWETGLAAGLLDGGVDLRTASLVIGTSAGSVVGSRLASGDDPRPRAGALAHPRAGSEPDASGALAESIAPETLAGGFARLLEAFSSGESSGRGLVEIGKIALTASPIPEEDWVAGIRDNLEIPDAFPDGLLITTADTATGEMVALDAASGAPLDRAVAASCAVPGLFPPVTIDGRRLMDGGVRSITNAGLAIATEPGPVLIVTTLAGTGPAGTLFETWERRVRREVDQLEEAGHTVTVIWAEADDTAAIGFNPMDRTRTHLAVAAGRERGRREASGGRLAAWR